MRKLSVFESVTVNGYFAGPQGDLSWAHAHSADPEFQAFVQGNAASAGLLLFGRVTYQMMASYWPSAQAAQSAPQVAQGMNEAEKIVFSRSLARADWANTTLVKDDPALAVRALKQRAGKDLVVLGSGSIVAQLASAGLVDEYQLVVKPVALGAGRTLFSGIGAQLELRLASWRAFRDGNLVLNYAPVR